MCEVENVSGTLTFVTQVYCSPLQICENLDFFHDRKGSN